MSRLSFGILLRALFILTAMTASLVHGENCCDQKSAVQYGHLFGWAFHQDKTGCNLLLELEDGASLKSSLEQIPCKDYDTVIVNGRQLTKRFVVKEEDLAAAPANTNVIYENMPPVMIDVNETGEKIKSLNIVDTPELNFHPSLLDEADYITFDNIQLSYDSNERQFRIKRQGAKPLGDPKAEALSTSTTRAETLSWRMPSISEVVLMTVIAIQLMVIIMVVAICQSRTSVAKEVVRRESISIRRSSMMRTDSLESFSSRSRYSSDSDDGNADSVELLEIKRRDEDVQKSDDSGAICISIEEDAEEK